MVNTTKKSEKYIDLISQSADDDNKEQLQFRAEEAELQVKQAILETKKEITKTKRELVETKKAIPYDLQAEVTKTIELKELEDGLKVATEISKARF